MKINSRSPFVPLALLCVLGGATTAFAQDAPAATPPASAPVAARSGSAIDPAKEKSIRELLRITDAEKLARQSMKQMIAAMRQGMAEGSGGEAVLPTMFWTRMEEKFSDTATLVNAIIPVYDKHFTQEDIDGFIAFYRTPLGEKLLREQPMVQQESGEAGRIWGRQLAQQVMNEIEAEQAKTKKTAKPAKPAPTGKRKTK